MKKPTDLSQLVQTVSTAKPEDLVFLIVDDDSNVRKTVIDYLGSFGFTQLRQATTGKEALDILEKERVDFIISDWEMPEMTGIDLLMTLRTDERFKNIPFIMVTSQASREKLKIEKAATGKVSAYILKPFRAQTLREKIETLLAHTLARKSLEERKGALVVDDDAAVLATVSEYLTEMGYKPVYKASDGDEGFKMLRDHVAEISLVLSDWEMPKMAGIDLLKKIRADADLHDTPFIMITSQTSIERIKLQNAIEAHVDHYLLKPFKVSDLRKKIDTTLKKAQLSLQIKKELEQAEKAILEHRYGEAEKVYDRVLKMDKTNVEAYLGMARLHIIRNPQKGADKAIQAIRAAIKFNPGFEKSYIQLAQLFERALSLEKAIAVLNEGIKECNFSEKLHFHLGRILLTRGLRDRGVIELKKALELRPDFKEAEELLKMWATNK